MSREEIRISIPSGPDQRAQALAVMMELRLRAAEEEEKRANAAKIETEEHEIIEGETT